ncbi:MAG: twin-arginine translocase subunit TatC [Nitrospiraceae bacterium]|nr:MAG: twin-arginine translocase subunit TatC [Nitrospiraceae bacterium]
MDKAPLTEHLYELRNRIVASLITVAVTFGFCFYNSEYIFELLTSPMRQTLAFSLNNPYISFIPAQNPNIDLVFLAPAEAFWMHMKIAFISAFIISSPVIFWEIWKFIAPGLHSKERKYAAPFIITATFLFLIGAMFCFFIVLPLAVDFLLNYKTQHIKPMISAEKYMDFCLKFIIAFGAIFELPVLIIFLTRMGLVTTAFLAKHRKYAILIAFVIAAILTPTPDAFNQTLMAVPILVLYEAGILASRILNIKKKPEEGSA